MASGPIPQNELVAWEAKDWDELSEIWSALLPPLDDDAERFVPSFRGNELTPHQAGSVFERWIVEAFRLDGADVDAPYVVTMTTSRRPMEQIDGLVRSHWQAFIIESKNWAKDVDFAPIARLNEQVQRRPPSTLGLVFSSKGFTSACIDLVAMIRPLRILLFDRLDLEHVVRERNMVIALQTKWHLAVKYGKPSLPVWTSDE